MKTADKETSSTGKVTYEQWSRCRIIERMDASATYPEGAVKVKYLEDAADEEPLIYDIEHFILNADPAPRHLIDLAAAESSTSVSYEQPVLAKEERGELLPLQRKKISDPKAWKKNARKFDASWGKSYDLRGEKQHVVPKCKKTNCLLDCNKLTHDNILYAREAFTIFVKLGQAEKMLG